MRSKGFPYDFDKLINDKEYRHDMILMSIEIHDMKNWGIGIMNVWFTCREDSDWKYDIVLNFDKENGLLIAQPLPLKLAFSKYHYDLNLNNGLTNNTGFIELV